MKAPLMLPWFARKWGVDDVRALDLWRRACRDSEMAVGNPTSSQYWGIAKSRFIDLLDNEVLARVPASEIPWVMIELNLLRFMAALRCWVMSVTSQQKIAF